MKRLRTRPTVQRISALLAAVAVLTTVYLGQGLDGPHAVAAALMVVVPGAAFGLAVWRFLLTRKARARWPGPWLGHLALAGLFAAAWTGIIFLLALVVRREAAFGFLRNAAIWQFIGGIAVYAAIAAGAQAVRTRERLEEQEAAMARAELQALRAQLDPHFLFNTLHSLTQLAHEDPDATERALEQFAALMRYVLQAGRHSTPVSVEDELAFIRNYLELERLRLGERLRVVEQIDPEALELELPPLVLQPVMENAIRHGVAPLRRGGCIHVTITLDDSRLVVEIADDGPGDHPDRWRSAEGLGLKAVQRQLEARYPGDAHFEVQTSPAAGFTVRMNVPAVVTMGGRR